MSTKPKHPISKAITDVRKGAGVTQVQLADAMNLIQPYISAWETFRIPSVEQIHDIEVALKLPAGTILRRAGYVLDADNMTLEQRVAMDSTISRDTRRVLLSVLEADRLKGQRPEDRRQSKRPE